MKLLRRFTATIRVLILVAFTGGMPAWAAAPILIWPVDPVIEADRSAGALWLENRGDSPVVMQIRTFHWTQADGEDQFEEQGDVEVSPPMARIQPGARQLVRLISDQAARAPGESAYRVVVDEVPTRLEDDASAAPDSGAAHHSAGVRFRMRYSIPLFIYAPLEDGTKLEPKGVVQLRCSLVNHGERTLVRLTNEGRIHAGIVRLEYGGRTNAKV